MLILKLILVIKQFVCNDYEHANACNPERVDFLLLNTVLYTIYRDLDDIYKAKTVIPGLNLDYKKKNAHIRQKNCVAPG